MIVARNGQIRSRTGHDHGWRPNCLNMKFRHNGTRVTRQAGTGRHTAAGHRPRRPSAALPTAGPFAAGHPFAVRIDPGHLTNGLPC